MRKQNRRSGFGVVELLLAIVIIILIGFIGFIACRGLTAKSPSPAPTNSYDGWKTYTSKAEKVTFKYPANWIVDAEDALRPNDPTNNDYVALKSPDGKVVVHWTSEVDGFGDEHTDLYPYNEIVNKAAIPGAANHYVVSAITTLDGTTYSPWMAAEDSIQVVKFSKGVAGNVAFFTGVNNINPTTNSPNGVLFSTSGFRTNQDVPSLSKAEAKAYLANSDMQQAKLILLSLHY